MPRCATSQGRTACRFARLIGYDGGMGSRLKLAVFIAEVAIFGGHYANWIHQRHEFLARNDARIAEREELMNPRSPKFAHARSNGWIGDVHRKTPKHASSLLGMFGEPPQNSIMLVYRVDRVPGNGWFYVGPQPQMEEQLPKDEIELAEKLFPEADFRFRIYDLIPK